MPSENLERTLAAIDSGLQTPDPTVVAATAAPRPTTCWRCSQNKTSRDSGLCEGCRAWCACETDDDPAARVHRRVDVSNVMGDVPETRPTIAGPTASGRCAVSSPVGMWARLFASVNGRDG